MDRSIFSGFRPLKRTDDDYIDMMDATETTGLIIAKVIGVETAPASLILSFYSLYKTIDSYLKTKQYYKDMNVKLDKILNETQTCIAKFKSTFNLLDENSSAIKDAQAIADKNIEALKTLNSTINAGFEKTMESLNVVDGKVQNIVNRLEDSTNNILDKIESVKDSIINLMHDSRTEKILAELSTFLEFIMYEATQLQSLPLNMRIEKIKIDKGFIDFLTDTRDADQPMLSLLTEIIDFGIAIPKDTADTLSLSVLELLCHGVDVYLFIVTFLIQQYGILATDYFYKSDIDNYNAYMLQCETIYNDFKILLLKDDIGLVPKITKNVLNTIKNGDFISGNQEMQELVELNLNKFELIQNFFARVQFNTDAKSNFVKDIKFDTSIETPILDWKNGSIVSYASQCSGNKTTLGTQVSDWLHSTLTNLANPFVTIDPDNSNCSRVILRKFDNGDPQIVALVKNSTQGVFRDIDRDLYNAASEPNVDLAWENVQVYLKNEANVSAIFEHSKRAIHVATENNNWQVADALIKNGANINEIDEKGFSPIYIATEAGYEQFVDKLIELKADVNVVTGIDNHHFTPLHSAVFHKRTNIVKKLLQVPSIDIRTRTTNGITSLNLAVLNNHNEIIDLYLNKNIHEIVDIQSVTEFPPIYFAYRNNNTAVANKLIDQCANVNVRLYDDKTLLHLAVMYSDSDVFKQLFDNFDISVKDVDGKTPLHYAVMFGNEDLTGFLLDRNADPNVLDNNGTPVIIFTVKLPEEKALAIIKLLVKYKVSINVPYKETKNTILHIACALGYLSVVKFLIENQASVNLKNSQNETPLHMASGNGYLEIVKLLLENKAEVDLQNEHGETPLHLASKIGHLFIVRSLIDKNANYTVISDTNETAVEYGVKGEGDLDMFKYFVKAVYKFSVANTATGLVMDKCFFLAAQKFKNNIISYYFENHLGVYNHFDFLKTCSKGLIESFKSGNIDSVKYILQINVQIEDNDVEEIDNVGWTVLYYAIGGKGDLEMVKFIIQMSKFTLTVDDKKYGKTLLHLAIETKKVAVANLLLEKKADFDNADFEGDTQLHYAAKYGLNHIADQLIGKVDKSSINKKNKQNKTPLFVGVEGEANLNLIQDLIDAGANLDGDNDKRSLLDAAIVANKTDVARKFKDQPINQTNLHVAASNSNIELVDLLVDYKKIDINLEDSENRKPIYSAVQGNGTLAMIQHLISKNVDMNNFDQSKCDNLITLAIAQKKLDVAMYLIGVEGADINKVGKSQISPLYQAISVDNSLFVAVLLEKGADYDFKLDNGTTPIDLIVDNKSNTIKFFNMIYRNEHNQTMLHLMALKNKFKAVQKFLERGAYVNVQDNDGNSPLHLAAKSGRLEIVKMMCEMKQKCLNVELKNENKQTALDLAKSAGQTEVVDYLEHKCQPKQRARRQIVEQFSEQPVSSGTGRPSWWVSDLVYSVMGTLGSITNEACQSVLSQSYYESRTASAQSISSLSASVNVHSTLLLLDVLARKFTGQSYVGTDSQSGCPLDARSTSLVIVEQFERMLNRLASENNSQLVSELDSFELYRSVENCLLSGQYSKIDRILLSSARDAFPSDSIEDSLLVMSVEELLNEVLLGKKDSSLVETSSM